MDQKHIPKPDSCISLPTILTKFISICSPSVKYVILKLPLRIHPQIINNQFSNCQVSCDKSEGVTRAGGQSHCLLLAVFSLYSAMNQKYKLQVCLMLTCVTCSSGSGVSEPSKSSQVASYLHICVQELSAGYIVGSCPV